MRQSKNIVLIRLEFENGRSKKNENLEVENVSRGRKVKKRKRGKRSSH